MRIETKLDQHMVTEHGDRWRIKRKMLYPRRWAALAANRLKIAGATIIGTEEDVTPDEMRYAVTVLMVKAKFNETRVELNQILEYDARKDEVHCIVSNAQGELFDAWVPGYSVAAVVAGCRKLAGHPNRRMKRLSELKREFRNKVMTANYDGPDLHIGLPGEK